VLQFRIKPEGTVRPDSCIEDKTILSGSLMPSCLKPTLPNSCTPRREDQGNRILIPVTLIYAA
jgi:hypothetical protein